MKTVSVIVSYYSGRDPQYLHRLEEQLRSYDAGVDFNVFVITNDDNVHKGIDVIGCSDGSQRVFRRNAGWNMGAWHCGASLSRSPYVMFMQDDSCIKRDGWLKAYLDCLTQSQGVGIVGSSINPNWDMGWDEVGPSTSGVQLGDHPPGQDRVDLYRSKIASWGVDPGDSCRHLQSIDMMCSREHAMKLTIMKEEPELFWEAVSMEIGISCQSRSLGLEVEQVGGRFQYVGHEEW